MGRLYSILRLVLSTSRDLREEVETVVAEEGEQNEDGNIYLRKATFATMKKLDSFIKESQRFNSLAFGMRNHAF